MTAPLALVNAPIATPIVLLLGGMLNDAQVWAEVRSLLPAPVDVRVADVGQDTSVAAMADRAWTLLVDAPLGQPIVIAGFSLGGYVALQMLMHPQRALHAAVLVSTSAQPESPEAAATRAKTLRAMGRDFAGTTLGIAQWTTHEAGAALLERLHAMMLRVGPAAAARQIQAVTSRADHRERLGQLTVPVTVLCGQQDRVTPPALSQALSGLIPGAIYQPVDNAGHMLPMEQPLAVAQAIAGHLQSLK